MIINIVVKKYFLSRRNCIIIFKDTIKLIY